MQGSFVKEQNFDFAMLNRTPPPPPPTKKKKKKTKKNKKTKQSTK